MPGMDKVAVVNALRGREADFHKLGVDALYLFGSTAADKQRGDSDVDLFATIRIRILAFSNWQARKSSPRRFWGAPSIC